MSGTHLGVLELLFDIIHETTADLANEAAIKQFRTNLAGPRHGPTDAHEIANLLRFELANARDKGEMMERDIEFAGLEVYRVRCRGRGVNLEIFRFKFGDEILDSASNVREEPIILSLDRFGQVRVLEDYVAVVNVERGKL